MSDYEKLKMTAGKSEGDFVRTLQGRTGTGLEQGTHVHKDWYAKTKSYDEGMEKLAQEKSEREDILAPLSRMKPSISSDGRFCFEHVDGRQFYPTNHALNQFGVATSTSTFFLNSLRENPTKNNGEEKFKRDSQDAETLLAVSENAMRRVDSEKVFRWRTYTDGTMRAWLSEKYAPVDNMWYMDEIRKILPGGRLSHWRGDADTIFGNILLPDTIIDYGQDDDSDYGGMLSIGNCEIGKRRISQMPSLFRSICMNGCIWGQVKGKNISRVHRGTIVLEELRLQIKENIEAQLPLLPQGIERMLGLRAMGTDGVRMKNVIATVCKDNRLSKKESTEVLAQWVEHERNDRNLFGVVNSVTRAGQTFANDSWVKFDELGGKLLDLNESRWTALTKRADSFDEKDFGKIFAGVE
tara:strand:+ start:568 stop:1797 length:1230 start_codon:yes stop_codon:yes gene_type:complete